MSEFRELGMLQVGASSADPEALARVVRNHKAGDALAQVALTVALMLAICAVTFALSMDRAAAATLYQGETSMVSHALMGSSALAVLGAVAVVAMALVSRLRQPQMKPIRIPVRDRAPRG
jgi:hypothetical protein